MPVGEVDGVDLAEQNARITLASKDLAGRKRVGALERLRGEQPTEPGADHHHLVSAARDGALCGALTHGSSVLIDVLTDVLVDVLVDAPEPMPGRPWQQR